MKLAADEERMLAGELGPGVQRAIELLIAVGEAYDAAYELAAQLLAAKLNLGAGAGTCTAAQEAIADADNLLSSIGFDGSGNYLGPKNNSDREEALSLANTLDQYNNGTLCP